METKGIIFDFGGTLDTNGDHWSRLIHDGWNKAGVAADDALFVEAYIYSEKELERTERILPATSFTDLLTTKIEIELQYLSQTGHFPPEEIEPKAKEIASYCLEVVKGNIIKIKPTLESLSSKYKMAVVSNYYGNLETVMKELGISQYFKYIADSKIVGKRKPDCSLLEYAVRKLELKSDEVVVVGDSYKNDIEPANKCGCKALLLDGRKWEDDEFNSSEVHVIKSLDEIVNFIG